MRDYPSSADMINNAPIHWYVIGDVVVAASNVKEWTVEPAKAGTRKRFTLKLKNGLIIRYPKDDV